MRLTNSRKLGRDPKEGAGAVRRHKDNPTLMSMCSRYASAPFLFLGVSRSRSERLPKMSIAAPEGAPRPLSIPHIRVDVRRRAMR